MNESMPARTNTQHLLYSLHSQAQEKQLLPSSDKGEAPSVVSDTKKLMILDP